MTTPLIDRKAVSDLIGESCGYYRTRTKEVGFAAAKVAAASDWESLKATRTLDKLLERIDADKLEIDDKNGFPGPMTKTLQERGLSAELSAELSYQKVTLRRARPRI